MSSSLPVASRLTRVTTGTPVSHEINNRVFGSVQIPTVAQASGGLDDEASESFDLGRRKNRSPVRPHHLHRQIGILRTQLYAALQPEIEAQIALRCILLHCITAVDLLLRLLGQLEVATEETVL